MSETALQTPRPVEKGQEVFQHQGFPAGVQPMCAALGGAVSEQVDACRRLKPFEKPSLEQICCQDLLLHGTLVLEQLIAEGLHQMGGTHTGSTCEKMQSMGRTHAGEVHGGLSPMGETPD